MLNCLEYLRIACNYFLVISPIGTLLKKIVAPEEPNAAEQKIDSV